MTAIFASRIRSIASLAMVNSNHPNAVHRAHMRGDALAEIIVECRAQSDQVVTLTVEQAVAIMRTPVDTRTGDLDALKKAHDAADQIRQQLSAIAEFERVQAEDRAKAKQR